MAGVETTAVMDGAILKARWESCGIQFRANAVEQVGASIALHSHSYPHVALVSQGVFKATEITESGERKEYVVAAKGEMVKESAGYRVTIPARHQHSFELVKGPGEILCMWGEG